MDCASAEGCILAWGGGSQRGGGVPRTAAGAWVQGTSPRLRVAPTVHKDSCVGALMASTHTAPPFVWQRSHPPGQSGMGWPTAAGDHLGGGKWSEHREGTVRWWPKHMMAMCWGDPGLHLGTSKGPEEGPGGHFPCAALCSSVIARCGGGCPAGHCSVTPSPPPAGQGCFGALGGCRQPSAPPPPSTKK